MDLTPLDDLRGLLRRWKIRPLFAVLFAKTIGVSLGLATAAFSLFDAILFRVPPHADSVRLVRVDTFST